jgi:hypothetical protein
MIKKLIAAATVTAALAAASPANAFLEDWFFRPDGTAATQTQINEFLDITGPSYVRTSVPDGGGNFSFTESGALTTVNHDGGAVYAGNFTAANEITALFQVNGTAQLNGALTFTSGTINVYSQLGTKNFATNTLAVAPAGTIFYGANDGTLIGTFDVLFGDGTINASGIPNGQETIVARATFLAPGYWIDPNGVTSLVGSPTGDLFGFATTNASRTVNATAPVISNIIGAFAGVAGYTNPGCLPGTCTAASPTGAGTGSFTISNNGQFRLVPEPGSVAITGLALALMGVFGRRRARK